jgi:RNA polymerase sigma-70 factor (ECF subfamily)
MEDIWAQGVIEQNRRWMLAFLYAVTGDEAAAEDLVQETFVVAYQKRSEFRKDQPFGAWLRGIARNLARRHLEKAGRRAVLVSSEKVWDAINVRAGELEQAHVDPGHEASRVSVLRECVRRLAAKARSLIQGRYGKGLNLSELGRRTGLAPASVPIALFRARSALSECVKRTLASNFYEGNA